ncbi:MAG: cytochrome c [Methylococcaceae bacterium]|nr:MAG: cytochrome c [Methylococcaceae bacterium]
MKYWLLIGLLAGSSALAANSTASGNAGVTFNKDVLPILQKNCQVCHRPGEIGPMSFLTYQSTLPWAGAIKSAVVAKKMPPWFADPRYGHFMNEKRLSDAEIATVAAWVDQGAPEGDARDKPAPLQFREGWNIRPDRIFRLAKPFKVPAKGTVDYVYFTVSSPFQQDTWVSAGEIRPGNHSVVHHVIANVRPRGSKWVQAAQLGTEPYMPGPTYINDLIMANGGDPSVLDNQFLVGFVPGMEAQRFDIDNSAKLIPAGADIVFEMHYTPSGAEEEDQTMLGLELAPAPPKRRFLSVGAATLNLDIAPGDPNAEAKAQLQFGPAVDLAYMQPHMHLRGKDMRIDAIYPGGGRETLLNVPHYDFEWQIVYYEKQPVKLPAGTTIELIGHFDNSAANKNNPDPAQRVRFGFQSEEEMLSAPLAVIVDRDVDPAGIVIQSGIPGALGTGVAQ